MKTISLRLRSYTHVSLPIQHHHGKERTKPGYIAHNGEINTIRANVNKMLAREESMHSKFLDENSSKILPITILRVPILPC